MRLSLTNIMHLSCAIQKVFIVFRWDGQNNVDIPKIACSHCHDLGDEVTFDGLNVELGIPLKDIIISF